MCQSTSQPVNQSSLKLRQKNESFLNLKSYPTFFSFILLFFGWGEMGNHERNNLNAPISLTNGLIEQANLACPRNDVDPCSYSNNGDFANALVAELNSIIMGCPPPSECSPQCCLSSSVFGLATPIVINSQNINPWQYCCSREDCDTYECGTIGYLCNYADQVLQDSMLARARKRAIQGMPTCATSIKDIDFFLNTITEECTLASGCYSCEIYIQVYYYACNCE
ncbi:MAG: hypothetical protein IPM48_08680 [Saprospiraceae bacterium]|nr:hypothetical protein [Saprospiraceae bacterium]